MLWTKERVTSPAEERTQLRLHTGDTVFWETTEDGRVWMRRLEPLDLNYLAAIGRTLSERNSAKVPFPFTDRQASKTRPALVLSDEQAFNTAIGHSVLAMITSAKHSAWPLDTPIENLSSAGLPVPLHYPA